MSDSKEEETQKSEILIPDQTVEIKEIPKYLVGVAETKVFKNGDPTVVYEKFDSMKLMNIEERKGLQNRFGYFDQSDIIGKEVGSKIFSRKRDHFISFLEPLPYLITETLAHKTQILYSMDIAMILLALNIEPGINVIESGTGSCSLSCSILNALKGEGTLFTFEYNEERVINAKKVIESFKFTNCNVYHQDVYNDGFGDIPNTINAVFLDLPKPWVAIPFAKAKMVSGGRICCFSPCIEQVMNNTQTLSKEGFVDVYTKEVLLREFKKLPQKKKRKIVDENGKEKIVEYNVTSYSSGVNIQKGHTGYLTFAFLP